MDANSTASGGTLARGPLGVGPINVSGGTLQGTGAGMTLANAVTLGGSVGLANVTFGSSGLSTPNTVTLSGSPTLHVAAPVTISDRITGGAAGHGGIERVDLIG